MSRYTGSACKVCRQRGEKLFLKGTRCYTAKCSFSKRSYPPGIHGPSKIRGRKFSDYGLRLKEKQKARSSYGIVEKQFVKYFKKAAKQKGMTGENFIRLLETRLDNFVYRLGLCVSRRQSRQLVRHGHILVNDKKVNIPSFILRVGDKVKCREKSLPLFKDAIENISKNKQKKDTWYLFDSVKKEGVLLKLPTREEVDIPVDEQLIVEFYSR